MRRPRLTPPLLLAGALALGGCASAGSTGFEGADVTLRVINRSGARIAVSAIWAGGNPVFAGDVQNRRDRTLSIDHTRAAHLQVRVEFADGGTAFSNRLSVDPDETVELRVGVDRVPELVPVDEEEAP